MKPSASTRAPTKNSDNIIVILSGAARKTLCMLEITSVSFLVNKAYGLVVAVNILKAQGK